ncbi:MAG: hypothetical protein K1X88_28660 [Nannocystaceae bacterium]|nr:hypothetical protein [Nannocystaceae bacterium]
MAARPDGSADRRAVGILARSLFRQMRHQGYSPEQIITLSTELLQLVREDLAAGVPEQ